jgi:DNA-binding transcriptional MerR regulator
MTNKNKKYYSVKEVAEIFSVHPYTVHRWIKEGRFESKERKNNTGKHFIKAESI